MTPDYPLFLYLYNENGRYRDAVEIAGETELESAMAGQVRDHIRRRLEVRITNAVDELVFHAQGGKVLWPMKERVRTLEC